MQLSVHSYECGSGVNPQTFKTLLSEHLNITQLDVKRSNGMQTFHKLDIRTKKQEAHGPHRSPEEEFYTFSISFYKLTINSPCRRAWLFI